MSDLQLRQHRYNLRLVLAVVVAHLEETILAGVQMTVQSTFGFQSLVTELASVHEGSREMCRLNVLNQTCPVKLRLLTKLATECCFAFVYIFGFFHKIWEVSRVALLLGGVNAAAMFTLGFIFTAGQLRKPDFLVTET